MAERDGRLPEAVGPASSVRLDLAPWAVATFHVAVLVLVVVFAGHVTGVVAEVLPGVGTLPGVVAFGYLWALALLAVGWALPEEGLGRDDALPLRTLAGRGTAAGASVGAAFAGGPLVLFAAVMFLAEGGDPLPFVAIVALGALLAGLVGAVVGALSVAIDVACYRAAAHLVPRNSERGAPEHGD